MERQTWTKTRLKNLLRHKSGRYYARAYVRGKEVWQSLGTTLFSVAQEKLPDFLKQYRAARRREKGVGSAKMTFDDAVKIHMENLDCDVDIKQRTRNYWRETLTALYKSWPELAQMPLRSITKRDLKQWAKGYSVTASTTRYNNTVHLLRHVLQIGIEEGILGYNFATELKRVSVKRKELELPSLAQFNALVREIWNGHGRFSKACADLVAGLAFTGLRKGEASWLTWGDIDFHSGRMHVRGHPETGTKGNETRRVRLLPDARTLFERMRQDFADDGSLDRVFKVSECQKAIDRAAKKIGMKRIVHHDLRHFFATRCIESGVDIPTVSRWLGHKDGGVLAMKTYGHLRDEHDQAQAERVSFSAFA
jgi:integrase